ncbi:MAG: hypothetical protein QM730_19195 [Anaerolineales bacterium]
MKTSTNRFPTRLEIEFVFGFLVFAVFTWSIRGFLAELPSFLLYYTLGNIFGVFSYMMAFALLESLLIMGLLLLAAFILPIKWLRQGFARKATALVLVAGGAMIYLQKILTFQLPSLKELALVIGLPLLALIVLLYFVMTNQRLQTILDNILERFRIFLYIYVPLGLIGFFVMIVRNIF